MSNKKSNDRQGVTRKEGETAMENVNMENVENTTSGSHEDLNNPPTTQPVTPPKNTAEEDQKEYKQKRELIREITRNISNLWRKPVTSEPIKLLSVVNEDDGLMSKFTIEVPFVAGTEVWEVTKQAVSKNSHTWKARKA